jgi:hypothetical protein
MSTAVGPETVMSEVNAVLALKNAWNSVIATSDRVRELGPAVQALPDGASPTAADLETYHSAALAQANAVMALRGLVERLREIASK